MTKTNRQHATHPDKLPPRAKGKRPFQDITVDQVMSTDVLTVSTSTPLSEVERALAEAHVSGVPVTDSTGRIVGVLSLHDIADRHANEPEERPTRTSFYGVDSEQDEDGEPDAYEVSTDAGGTAGEAMSAQVFSVPATATLREVAHEMLRREVHRLVVQDHGKVAGIVSTTDLLRAMAF
jgi:CBS domain-containing protein